MKNKTKVIIAIIIVIIILNPIILICITPFITIYILIKLVIYTPERKIYNNYTEEKKQEDLNKNTISSYNPNIENYKINYFKKTDINNRQNENYVENYMKNKENYKKYYNPKRYITTINELNFYTTLLEISKELDLILFAQVSLYSIIEPKKELNYRTRQIYTNKINRKSIDFVLVDKRNCRIKLCIELDDTTHTMKSRKERDNFINKLFEELEIPLLRHPVYTIYYKETLKKKILEKIKK